MYSHFTECAKSACLVENNAVILTGIEEDLPCKLFFSIFCSHLLPSSEGIFNCSVCHYALTYKEKVFAKNNSFQPITVKLDNFLQHT